MAVSQQRKLHEWITFATNINQTEFLMTICHFSLIQTLPLVQTGLQIYQDFGFK